MDNYGVVYIPKELLEWLDAGEKSRHQPGDGNPELVIDGHTAQQNGVVLSGGCGNILVFQRAA